MIKTKNIQKIFRTEEVKTYTLYFVCLLILFIVEACGNSRHTGLSDKELFAQQKSSSDKEVFIVPAGIKYKESRAVDPAYPPVVLEVLIMIVK